MNIKYQLTDFKNVTKYLDKLKILFMMQHSKEKLCLTL